MKQTNYPLYDFLDFDPAHPGEESLWKACRPTNIGTQKGDVVVTIPFQRQQITEGMVSDRTESRREYPLRLRAYGKKILRISMGFGCREAEDSSMLEFHPDLKASPLKVEKNKKKWVVTDSGKVVKTVFDFEKPLVDYWSDLIPSPEEALVASFFPDGNTEVRISAWDQFTPARQEAFAMAFVEKDAAVRRSTLSFSAAPDEVFAGTGERFSKMDLSGKTVQMNNQDAQGVNNRRAYKNIPFYLSSRKYGVFLHTPAFSKFSLADHSSRSVQLMTEEPELDLFLFGGHTPEEILYLYRQVTGFPSMPPMWSFGTWMSRMTYFSADEVERVCDRLRKEDFPCDVIHIDTGWFRTNWLCEWKFSPERFPDPPGFIAKLKKKGFRVSLWQMPYIAAEAEQLAEAVENRYIGQTSESPRQGGSNFSALDHAGTIDFTYPQAVEWYKGLLKELLQMGVACIKTDFGEDIHMNAVYHGMKPERLKNLYGLLYQKAAWEITREVTGEGIIWARTGWSGCQRYPLHWGGDAAASWDGLAGSLKGGLHLGLSGFAFWSHDVPGFHGVPDFMNSVIPDDLYIRWTQVGVFSSHIRYHGTSKREPYEYPEIAPMVRKWWKLRYALIPYILQQSAVAVKTGYPLLRALVFHHPEDITCWHIDDQYYFGNDFLVAPVMNHEGKRNVYLPEGRWVNFFNGEITQGEKWLKNQIIPLEEMPLWVREGAVIPVYGHKVNCTDEIDVMKAEKIVFDEKYNGLRSSRLNKLLGF
jgi:alpha-D-xyloside xylohydrolase